MALPRRPYVITKPFKPSKLNNAETFCTLIIKFHRNKWGHLFSDNEARVNCIHWTSYGTEIEINEHINTHLTQIRVSLVLIDNLSYCYPLQRKQCAVFGPDGSLIRPTQLNVTKDVSFTNRTHSFLLPECFAGSEGISMFEDFKLNTGAGKCRFIRLYYGNMFPWKELHTKQYSVVDDVVAAAATTKVNSHSKLKAKSLHSFNMNFRISIYQFSFPNIHVLPNDARSQTINAICQTPKITRFRIPRTTHTVNHKHVHY
jgi:hypothetical protein